MSYRLYAAASAPSKLTTKTAAASVLDMRINHSFSLPFSRPSLRRVDQLPILHPTFLLFGQARFLNVLEQACVVLQRKESKRQRTALQSISGVTTTAGPPR